MSAKPPVAVLGAGIGGLVAARHLRRRGFDVRVFEGGKQIAGMAATHIDPDGFTYDVGGHFVTNRLAAALGVGARCRTVRHYGEAISVDGHYHSYPVGLMAVPRFARSAAAARVRSYPAEATTVAERFRREYGTALADEIAIPIVEAWAGVSADRLAPSVADKIPQSITETLRLHAARRVLRRAVAIGYCGSQPQSSAVYHVYPDEGVATLCHAVAAELGDLVELESPVERIYTDGGRAVGVRVAGNDIDALAVVSTAPLSILPRLVDGTDVLAPFAQFRFRGMAMVNLKLEGTHLLRDTMVWLPTGAPFFRLTEATQSMPWLAPEGKTLVLAEIGSDPGDATWTQDDAVLIETVLDALEPIVPGVRGKVIGATVLRQPLAYPVYSLDYEAERQRFEREGTGVRDLLSVGRNGEFAHILMEDIYWRTQAIIDRWASTRA